ncbi:MaoC family dehydratase N-terminal domain-containing protein [Gryllotalpicola sp.]|uniref:FAS1-like dehydratase domain-containing protein n=1 Tax=Gryllotalpicola sp. TaxID=1932787 RepID=UPI00260C5412|nr:MaoC family dehydratase N-terminal domain-containing protein [Gryllotalpicola sp.]
MTINLALEGRTLPPTVPYTVGVEKIREFARAVFAGDTTGAVAPPTFAIVIQQLTLDQLLDDPDVGIDFSKVVHGDQHFVYSRTIVPGDELTGQLTVTSVKSLGGNAMITADTVVTDRDGAHVVTATSTLVVRGGD